MQDGTALLCDLGSCRWFGSGPPPRHFGSHKTRLKLKVDEYPAKQTVTSLTCTCQVAPPEHDISLHSKSNAMGATGDAWSWCCIAAKLFASNVSKDIFYDAMQKESTTQMQKRFFADKDVFLATFLSPHAPPDLIKMLLRGFVKCPEARATPEELLADPFWDGYTMDEAIATSTKYYSGKMAPMPHLPASVDPKDTSVGPLTIPTFCMRVAQTIAIVPLKHAPKGWATAVDRLVASRFFRVFIGDAANCAMPILFMTIELAARVASCWKSGHTSCIEILAGSLAVANALLSKTYMDRSMYDAASYEINVCI